MYNHVFSRHEFLDGSGITMDMPVGLGRYPITDKKAQELLEMLRTVARQHGKNVNISIWARHEDGTEFKIAG